MTILFTLVAVGRICACCLMMPLLATLETDPPLFTSGHTSRHFWVSPFITKFPSSTTPRNLWTCLPQPIMDRIWWAHTLRQRRAMLQILRDVISTPLNRSSLVPISSASHEYVRSLRAQTLSRNSRSQNSLQNSPSRRWSLPPPSRLFPPILASSKRCL